MIGNINCFFKEILRISAYWIQASTRLGCLYTAFLYILLPTKCYRGSSSQTWRTDSKPKTPVHNLTISRTLGEHDAHCSASPSCERNRATTCWLRERSWWRGLRPPWHRQCDDILRQRLRISPTAHSHCGSSVGLVPRQCSLCQILYETLSTRHTWSKVNPAN